MNKNQNLIKDLYDKIPSTTEEKKPLEFIFEKELVENAIIDTNEEDPIKNIEIYYWTVFYSNNTQISTRIDNIPEGFELYRHYSISDLFGTTPIYSRK